jgi:hypothetical protein
VLNFHGLKALWMAWRGPTKIREAMLLQYTLAQYLTVPLIGVLFVFKRTSPWYFYSALHINSVFQGMFGLFLALEVFMMFHALAQYLCLAIIQIYYFGSSEALLQIFR